MSTYMTASELSQAYQSVLKPTNKPEHEISQVTSTDDKYEVKLSIHNFEPDELSVKVIDRYVHVEGRHEEKNDKIGFFTRQFTRRYFLPEGAQAETIRCTYSVETNILTVTAPIVNKKPVKEIVIPIVIIGQQQLHPQAKHREKDMTHLHHHREKDKEREGEREQSRDRDRGDREKQKQREHQHQHHQQQHQHLHHHHQQHPQQQSTSASVTTASSSTTTTSRKHQKQQQSHHHHHHNHHNEPQKDKYQHQMNF